MNKKQVQPAPAPVLATNVLCEMIPKNLKGIKQEPLGEDDWVLMERILGDAANPLPPEYPVALLSYEGPPVRTKIENSPNFVGITNNSIIVVSIWNDGWIGVINPEV